MEEKEIRKIAEQAAVDAIQAYKDKVDTICPMGINPDEYHAQKRFIEDLMKLSDHMSNVSWKVVGALSVVLSVFLVGALLVGIVWFWKCKIDGFSGP